MNIQFYHNYFLDQSKHRSFMSFAHRHFGLDFAPWQATGQPWPPGYIAFSAFSNDQERCIASLSVFPADLWINNNLIPGLQLLTVATDPEFRRRGIQRKLWNNLLTWLHDHPVPASTGHPRDPHIHPKPQVFFLTTHPEAVAMYEHLGFRSHPEYTIQVRRIDNRPSATDLTPQPAPQHLNLHTQSHRTDISRLCQLAVPTGRKFYAQNSSLLEFLCTGPWSQSLWYLEDLDTVVILESQPSGVIVHQIITTSSPNIARLYKAMAPLIPQGGFLEFRSDMDLSALPKGFQTERVAYSEDILMINSNLDLPRDSMLPLIARA